MITPWPKVEKAVERAPHSPTRAWPASAAHYLSRVSLDSQGCRKLFRAGEVNSAKGASRALDATRGQLGQMVYKQHFACCVIMIF